MVAPLELTRWWCLLFVPVPAAEPPEVRPCPPWARCRWPGSAVPLWLSDGALVDRCVQAVAGTHVFNFLGTSDLLVTCVKCPDPLEQSKTEMLELSGEVRGLRKPWQRFLVGSQSGQRPKPCAPPPCPPVPAAGFLLLCLLLFPQLRWECLVHTRTHIPSSSPSWEQEEPQPPRTDTSGLSRVCVRAESRGPRSAQWRCGGTAMATH